MSEPNGCSIPMIFVLIASVFASLFGVTLQESGRSLSDLAAPDPCTVQAERADVAVRVGPGPNRAIRDYLPTNRAFPVIGKATAGDGSLWWKVDITGIEQAWVAQTDVAAVGGCALVMDVDAPPVILAPPTAPITIDAPVSAEESVPPNATDAPVGAEGSVLPNAEQPPLMPTPEQCVVTDPVAECIYWEETCPQGGVNSCMQCWNNCGTPTLGGCDGCGGDGGE